MWQLISRTCHHYLWLQLFLGCVINYICVGQVFRSFVGHTSPYTTLEVPFLGSFKISQALQITSTSAVPRAGLQSWLILGRNPPAPSAAPTHRHTMTTMVLILPQPDLLLMHMDRKSNTAAQCQWIDSSTPPLGGKNRCNIKMRPRGTSLPCQGNSSFKTCQLKQKSA